MPLFPEPQPWPKPFLFACANAWSGWDLHGNFAPTFILLTSINMVEVLPVRNCPQPPNKSCASLVSPPQLRMPSYATAFTISLYFNYLSNTKYK